MGFKSHSQTLNTPKRFFVKSVFNCLQPCECMRTLVETHNIEDTLIRGAHILPGAHLCNRISAVSYDLYKCQLVRISLDYFVQSCNIHLAHTKSAGKLNLCCACYVFVTSVIHHDSERQYTSISVQHVLLLVLPTLINLNY